MSDAGAVSAAAPAVSNELFWCHLCKGEIHPVLPDYTCPQCSGGFVEPVQESHRSGTGRLAGTRDFSFPHHTAAGGGGESAFDVDSFDDDYEDDDDDDDMYSGGGAGGPTGAQMALYSSDFGRLLRTLMRSVPMAFEDDSVGVRVRFGGSRGQRSGSGSNASTPGAAGSSATAAGGDVGTSTAATAAAAETSGGNASPDNDAAAAAEAAAAAGSQQPASAGQRSQRRPARRRRRGYAGHGFLPLEDILEQMFTNSFGGGNMGGGGGIGIGGVGGGGGGYFIGGNPGDYAFGPRGLDDIITQLLNQYEGGGHPPAKEDEIASLTSDKITEKDVASNAQCPVCFDEYELNQEVKRLACKHAFHEDCIVPWLKIHGTCPVCRSDLQGQAPPSPTAEHPPALVSSLLAPDQPGPSTRSTSSSTSTTGDPQTSSRSSGQQQPRQVRNNNNSRSNIRPPVFLSGPNANTSAALGRYNVSGNRNSSSRSGNATSSGNNNSGSGSSSGGNNSTGSTTGNNNNNRRSGPSGAAGSSSSTSSYLDQVD